MAAEKFKRPQLALAILGALISIALTDFITNVTKVAYFNDEIVLIPFRIWLVISDPIFLLDAFQRSH